MTESEIEELRQFLEANWYQRDESDSEIISEILSEESPEYVNDLIQLAGKFLAEPQTGIDKEQFIRDAVWRYVDGGEIPYTQWLHTILTALKS